jgi:DNA-binding protein HU-beta
MNKHEVIGRMAEICEGTKKDAEKALMAFLQTVEEAVEKGDKVQLVGHMTVGVKPRKGGEKHNPKNPGEKIMTENKMVPFVKIGKVYKDAALKVPYREE